ncbi:unnamed protein product, partial [Symbiodinium necroappetens]
MNMGFSKRSYLVPLGNTAQKSVADSNILASRTCLLLMMVLALNGVFVLEQPALSWFEWFPRFRDLCKKWKIWRVSWYMLHYGAPTPKRHFAYSNSPCIRRFSRGKLRGWKKKVLPGAPKSAHYYKDAKGKKCYVGTKFLKGTGSGTEFHT